MRMSRVLLAGVAVAAAGVATSAYTASNTVPDSVAGYSSADVSGAEATNINYVLDGTDKSLIDSIDFDLVGDLDDKTAILTLKDGTGVVGSPVTCTVSAFTTVTPVSCPTPDRPLEDFDGIGLTVVQ
jgi:hypothetical protein